MRAPEVHPITSVGIGYGEILEDVNIDLSLLTQNLHERGLSDDEICNLHIELSDQQAPKNNIGEHYGVYNQLNDQITIYLHSGIEWVPEIGALFLLHKIGGIQHNNENAIKISSEKTSELKGLMEGSLNETLSHEVEHRTQVEDTELQKDIRKYKKHRVRKIVAESVAHAMLIGSGLQMWNYNKPASATMLLEALRSWSPSERKAYRFNAYENAPHEILAREAEAGAKPIIKVGFLRPDGTDLMLDQQRIMKDVFEILAKREQEAETPTIAAVPTQQSK